ncbi:sec-independent protein translocase protein TatC [Bathymodiolus platifrons methanotrophic gill symbiont]|nr:sec-independent protein translocase protein TatC [Bathymodiolus platifrons methanotrophic gill symbiont]
MQKKNQRIKKSMAKNEEQEQPLISHLVELRNRLLKVVLSVLLVFLAMTPFANEIYSFLAKPLMQFLPENTSMVAIDVVSPFLTPFKLVLVAAIFIAIPVILYQFWAFVAPGLYAHEKRMIAPLLVASTLLFALGMVFAYFVVFPLVFGFLTSAVPEGVSVMTDIAKYLDFVLTMFFAFGMAFEVPIVTIVLVWVGVFTPQQLAEKRPYIIVGAFIVGMFLTPPDAISQTLLAVPIWLLFETGLLFSRLFVRKSGQRRLGSD